MKFKFHKKTESANDEMEPHLKQLKGQPFILELASLEKVIDELGSDKSTKSSDSNETVRRQELRDSKHDVCLKYCDNYLNDDRSVLSSEQSNTKLVSSNDEHYQLDEFSDITIREDQKKNGKMLEIETSNCINDVNKVQDKTGLDKLIPYHLFNCINPDILIRISDVEFGVHRPLLKLYTNYFEEAISTMDECIVTLPDNKVTMDAFQAIYSWMLHESEEALSFIDRKNIANIFVAAKYLKIEELINTCKTILESKELFNEMTAFSLFMEAYNQDDKELLNMMLPRIQSVFLHVVSSSLFVNLPIDIILMLLSSDFIKIHSELEVFYSGIKWLLNDWPARGYNAIRIMNAVRFALLRPSQLIDLKRCPDSPIIKMITNGKDILKLIDDGIALSVKLETHSGSPELLKDECEKLGLILPSPRCWFEESLVHQSYEDFLQSLDIIKKQHHYA